MGDIIISDVRFDTMSVSTDVKIRVVSFIAPKPRRNKMIDITLELFMFY